jgi:hypothetical protein
VLPSALRISGSAPIFAHDPKEHVRVVLVDLAP